MAVATYVERREDGACSAPKEIGVSVKCQAHLASGRDYMHARYYNPNEGRFLSLDPVLGRAHEPQSWNRYVYVMNNPLVRVDRDGRCGEGASFIGPRQTCSDMARNLLSKGTQAAVKFIATHQLTGSLGVTASAVGI